MFDGDARMACGRMRGGSWRPHVLYSGADDAMLKLWDVRLPGAAAATADHVDHEDDEATLTRRFADRRTHQVRRVALPVCESRWWRPSWRPSYHQTDSRLAVWGSYTEAHGPATALARASRTLTRGGFACGPGGRVLRGAVAVVAQLRGDGQLRRDVSRVGPSQPVSTDGGGGGALRWRRVAAQVAPHAPGHAGCRVHVRRLLPAAWRR